VGSSPYGSDIVFPYLEFIKQKEVDTWEHSVTLFATFCESLTQNYFIALYLNFDKFDNNKFYLCEIPSPDTGELFHGN